MKAQNFQGEAGTLTEQALALLHRDILSGDLSPGVKLGISNLVKRYNIGATPLREALSRLTAQNLIMATDRRGFFVRELSYEDLDDITSTRFVIEREGVRLSMLHGDDAWEASVISHLHQLRLFVERNGSDFNKPKDQLDQLHSQFHASLLSACGSPRLIEMSANLYSQAFRYRHIAVRTLYDPEQYVTNHVQLAEVVLGRDEAICMPVLEKHLRATLHWVYPDRKDE